MNGRFSKIECIKKRIAKQFYDYTVVENNLDEKIGKLIDENKKLIGECNQLEDIKKTIVKEKQDLNENVNYLNNELEIKNNRINEYHKIFGNITLDNNSDEGYNFTDPDAHVLDHLVKCNNGMTYNDEQLKVIRHKSSNNLRVIAGAGSGKTQTICAKAYYLKSCCKVQGNEIKMCTFTNKAAKEMKERICKMEGKENTDIQISTFHSWFMNDYRELINMNIEINNHKILKLTNPSTYEYSNLLSRLKKKYDLFEFDTLEDKSLAERISYWTNMQIDKNEIIKSVVQEYGDKVKCKYGLEKAIVGMLDDLEKCKAEEGITTYDDYLSSLCDLLEKSTQAREKLRSKYKYIFIDEFQDINPIQMKIINFICKDDSLEGPKLIIVGDDDQSIYFFRGAEPKFIKNFDVEYPNTDTIKLMKNYRSTKKIIQLGNRVINKNKNRVSKEMEPVSQDDGVVKYLKHFDLECEAKCIINKIKSYKESGKNYKDICILYPSKNEVQVITKYLTKYKIPFYTDKKIEESIFDIIEFDKLIEVIDVDDEIKFKKHICHMAFLSDNDIINIKNNQDIYEIVKKKNYRNYKEINNVIKKIFESYNNKNDILRIVDYWLELPVVQANILAEERAMINDEIKELKTLEKVIEYRKGFQIKENNNKENSEKMDSIKIMTIHGSKGLGIDVVFLLGLYEGALPSQYTSDESEEDIRNLVKSAVPPTLLEEQRRLLYVAITRAKKHLYISYPSKKNNKFIENSRFLAEVFPQSEDLIDCTK